MGDQNSRKRPSNNAEVLDINDIKKYRYSENIEQLLSTAENSIHQTLNNLKTNIMKQLEYSEKLKLEKIDKNIIDVLNFLKNNIINTLLVAIENINMKNRIIDDTIVDNGTDVITHFNICLNDIANNIYEKNGKNMEELRNHKEFNVPNTKVMEIFNENKIKINESMKDFYNIRMNIKQKLENLPCTEKIKNILNDTIKIINASMVLEFDYDTVNNVRDLTKAADTLIALNPNWKPQKYKPRNGYSDVVVTGLRVLIENKNIDPRNVAYHYYTLTKRNVF